MKRLHYRLACTASFLFFLSFVFSHCSQDEKSYRTPTGLVFRIVSSPGKDSVARMGNTVKLHYIQKAGDSVIENNWDKMPFYWMMMPGFGSRYNPLEAFDYGLREGDSLVVIQRVDSMLKKHIFDTLPRYLKMTDEWITYMKVVKVFSSDSLLLIDKLREQQRADSVQRIVGEQRVKEYLKKNNINAVRQDSGFYLQIVQQGAGAKVDSGQMVGIKYVFNNLSSGRLFDTDTSHSFRHPDTLKYVVDTHYMLKAIDQGLEQLRVGAHAKMYLPTMLAFGGRPPKGNIHAYDDLSFEVWVLSLSSGK